MTNLISSIPLDAPLFRPATEEELLAIILKLSQASYHYADDTSKEWGQGRRLVAEAATEVNRLRLGYIAILALYRHAPQLLGESEFIDTILKDARK